MENIQNWITKISGVWVAVGSLLIVMGGSMNLPEWLPKLFTPEFVEATTTAIGAVIIYYQYLRGLFAKEEPEVQILSNKDKAKFALNPFKLRP